MLWIHAWTFIQKAYNPCIWNFGLQFNTESITKQDSCIHVLNSLIVRGFPRLPNSSCVRELEDFYFNFFFFSFFQIFFLISFCLFTTHTIIQIFYVLFKQNTKRRQVRREIVSPHLHEVCYVSEY